MGYKRGGVVNVCDMLPYQHNAQSSLQHKKGVVFPNAAVLFAKMSITCHANSLV